ETAEEQTQDGPASMPDPDARQEAGSPIERPATVERVATRRKREASGNRGSGDRHKAGRPEETRKMARATSAPVPVIDSAATGETGAVSATSGAGATSGATAPAGAKGASAKAGKSQNRNLGGPWGASFLGLEPNRSDGK